MAEQHQLLGGKLRLYKRPRSHHWQCAAFIDGKNWRVSTREDSLAHAKDFAEDWYLGLKGKSRAGILRVGKTFKEAAKQFEAEYEALAVGERSESYIAAIKLNIRLHLSPFFGDKLVTEINPDMIQEYRIHRTTSRRDKEGNAKRPARNTIHQEIIALRHVLKTANRKGWLPYLPDLKPAFRKPVKISQRAWFSPDEYKKLYKATGERAKNPKKERWRHASEQLHDYVLFMVNTGMRTDEASNLEFRDVAIGTDPATGERILEMELRGKRGVGYCKSMPGAVKPFERVSERAVGGRIDPSTGEMFDPEPTARVFGKTQHELFKTILTELDLKRDRDGRPRSAYSLRHTYICMRLMNGADIYQVAKNCRTSVEVIEKYYAAHLKDVIDTSAVNVMKPKPKEKKSGAGGSKPNTKSPKKKPLIARRKPLTRSR